MSMIPVILSYQLSLFEFKLKYRPKDISSAEFWEIGLYMDMVPGYSTLDTDYFEKPSVTGYGNDPQTAFNNALYIKNLGVIPVKAKDVKVGDQIVFYIGMEMIHQTGTVREIENNTPYRCFKYSDKENFLNKCPQEDEFVFILPRTAE